MMTPEALMDPEEVGRYEFDDDILMELSLDLADDNPLSPETIMVKTKTTFRLMWRTRKNCHRWYWWWMELSKGERNQKRMYRP